MSPIHTGLICVGVNFLGAMFLVSVDPSILKRALGIFFLLFSIQRFYTLLFALRRKVPDRRSIVAPTIINGVSEVQARTVVTIDDMRPVSADQNVTLVHVEPMHVNGAHMPAADDAHSGIMPSGPASDDKMALADSDPTGRACTCSPACMRAAVLRFLKGGWRRCLPKTNKLIAGGFVAGLLAGFLNGSFGTGGPPLMIFYTYIEDLQKEQIRATTSYQGIISLPIRIASCIAYGIYDGSDWPIYLTCPFMSAVGLYFGELLHRRVNRDQVAQALMFLVFLSALNLSGVGDGTPFGYVMLVAFILTFVSFVLTQIWHVMHPPAHWSIELDYPDDAAIAAGTVVSVDSAAAEVEMENRDDQNGLSPPSISDGTDAIPTTRTVRQLSAPTPTHVEAESASIAPSRSQSMPRSPGLRAAVNRPSFPPLSLSNMHLAVPKRQSSQ